jgi:hypothetical protein
MKYKLEFAKFMFKLLLRSLALFGIFYLWYNGIFFLLSMWK